MFIKSTRTLHQYTGAGTSNQELDRSTLIPHLPDSFPAPSGTIWEGVDRSTLQLVAHLFPAETRGRVFFARFFERAAVEKSVIPDAARDTVYICTQSIATLGGELGLSNETTHQYVKRSMALGLLRKQQFMGKLAFLLFVGISHPPQTLEGHLDFLIQHCRRLPSCQQGQGTVVLFVGIALSACRTHAHLHFPHQS